MARTTQFWPSWSGIYLHYNFVGGGGHASLMCRCQRTTWSSGAALWPGTCRFGWASWSLSLRYLSLPPQGRDYKHRPPHLAGLSFSLTLELKLITCLQSKAFSDWANPPGLHCSFNLSLNTDMYRQVFGNLSKMLFFRVWGASLKSVWNTSVEYSDHVLIILLCQHCLCHAFG